MFKKLIFLSLSLVFLAQCGSETTFAHEVGESLTPASNETSNLPSSSQSIEDPFKNLNLGDDFGWGEFIRNHYQTNEVTSLPIPVYLAFFSDEEKQVIEEGITMANKAVGFNVFKTVATWTPQARLIYKVEEIYFSENNAATRAIDDYAAIIGYTYSRNVYLNGKRESARIVTDWAMEIRHDRINKWVIAHELGHAMGIQHHCLIDYENDTACEEDLEPNSLMGAVIGFNPTLDDYTYMMSQQGQLLLSYIKAIQSDF